MLNKLCPELLYEICLYLRYDERLNICQTCKTLNFKFSVKQEKNIFLSTYDEKTCSWKILLDFVHMHKREKIFDIVLVEFARKFWGCNDWSKNHLILTYYSTFLQQINLPKTLNYLTYEFCPDKQILSPGKNISFYKNRGIDTTCEEFDRLSPRKCLCYKKIFTHRKQMRENYLAENDARFICNYLIFDRSIRLGYFDRYNIRKILVDKNFFELNDYSWLTKIIIYKLIFAPHYCFMTSGAFFVWAGGNEILMQRIEEITEGSKAPGNYFYINLHYHL